jgi:hypothetical protein
MFGMDPDPTAQRRFGDEARTLARLSHPGLVAILDAGIEDDRPYLVMPLLGGGSLQSLLYSGPLTPVEVVAAGSRLAGALAHVHERGVVHRDLKPSNILLDREGEPYLADFGVALMAGGPRRTRSNEIVGTPSYLAPEQVLGNPVGPPADIYGLGLVLLECLTGRMEYPSGNNVAAAVARLHRSPRIPPSLPPGLGGLLAAMTETDAFTRPSAAAVEQELQVLSDGVLAGPWTDLPPVSTGGVTRPPTMINMTGLDLPGTEPGEPPGEGPGWFGGRRSDTVGLRSPARRADRGGRGRPHAPRRRARLLAVGVVGVAAVSTAAGLAVVTANGTGGPAGPAPAGVTQPTVPVAQGPVTPSRQPRGGTGPAAVPGGQQQNNPTPATPVRKKKGKGKGHGG